MQTEIVVSALPAAWVPSADLLLQLLGPGFEQHTVVHDPTTDGFVALPTRAEAADPVALSPDGGHMMLRSDRDGFGMCTLSTGAVHWYRAKREGIDRAVALSPGECMVATLTTTTGGLAAVDVTRLSGPERRRIWSTPGGWSAETTISWSPDATLIAATYESIDEEWATVILDRDGAVVEHLPETITLRSTNATWLDDLQLLCVDNDLRLSIVHIGAATRTPLDYWGRLPWAVIDGELVSALDLLAGGDTHLVATSLAAAAAAADQARSRPFLTIRPGQLVRAFDTVIGSTGSPAPRRS